MCAPEIALEVEASVPIEKTHGSSLTWWFRACCFCYSLVGIEMAWRLQAVECNCPSYMWRVEACLLLMQGCLSFLHDAYFAGRSPAAKAADRSCATFLTFCQPVKLAFCHMDFAQWGLLACSWTLGLLCFCAGARAFAAGKGLRYQVFHTLWHITLPLGGYLWIEYTRASVYAWPSQSGSSSLRGAPALGAGHDPHEIFWNTLECRGGTLLPVGSN
mmetsp:Transcript_139682/g.348316  ORF Transcript_139682/g.348316 Transcript_139682/m.348316 type:complete len:216 (+) Transcript_139682:108-755(+)